MEMIVREETLVWLKEINRVSGYLFLNRYGERITPRGISQQLKKYADKYGLAYNIEAAYTPYSDTGVFTVYFGCDAEDQERCVIRRRPLPADF